MAKEGKTYQGDKGPLSPADAKAFKDGKYTEKVLTKDVQVERLHGGGAFPQGRWVTGGARPLGLEGEDPHGAAARVGQRRLAVQLLHAQGGNEGVRGHRRGPGHGLRRRCDANPHRRAQDRAREGGRRNGHLPQDGVLVGKAILVGLLPKRSILSKLHSGKEFSAFDEVQEFQQRLAVELEKGTVERIPVGKMFSYTAPEEWYRDTETDIVYRYIPPEFPLKGMWARVEILASAPSSSSSIPEMRPSPRSTRCW